MPQVSTKLLFSLETLKERAKEHLDLQIAKQVEEVETLKDANSMVAEITEWRAIQEGRITNLYENLSTVDDQALARFSVEPMPRRETVTRRAAEQRLRDLEEKRSQVEAKASSLVTDEDGNLSLTKSQLREFFGL